MKTFARVALLIFLAACARKDAQIDSSAPIDTGKLAPPAKSSSLAEQTFVDSGACPFECCTYGQWRADSAVQLRRAPDSASAVAGVLAAGTTVTASTGEVHVLPGRFVMTRGERAYLIDRNGPPTPGDSFKVGDTLLVYTSRGEGAFKVRLVGSKGPMFELMLAEPGTGCEGRGACNGRMLSRPSSTWWVNMRATDGTSGWTTDARHFSGRDRCGAPLALPATTKRGS